MHETPSDSPTTNPDYTRTERERRDVRNHYGVGVSVGAASAAGLAAYAVLSGRYDVVLLIGGFIGSIVLIAWVHRCGGRHEHDRIEEREIAIQDTQQRILARIEGIRTEQRAEIDALTEAIEQALADLGAKVVADRQDRQIGRARVRIAEAISHLRDESTGTEYSVTSPTPSGGISIADYRQRRSEEDR